MALTKKDLELIKEVVQVTVQSMLNQLRDEMRLEFKQEIKGVIALINALKIYMETRFNDLEKRVKRLEKHPYLLRDTDT